MTKLYAPASYWAASDEERAAVVNGCGTKGLGGWLVPDTMYGLSIKPACNIHDWQYDEGKTIEDKASADRSFLNNMNRIINSVEYSWWNKWLRSLRKIRAKSYYEAVDHFGGSAFWEGKN